ncbi:MAG: NAD(P)-dependent alcohol dehydrogenase [Bryobacteraceae bacterium]|nr:NAD(P)-dependent alcohol dehydrogenase [Bryobacteraceae bacterium]
MKAVVYNAYGGREVLALEDLPEPGEPGAGELRIRVLAASVNPVDRKVREGQLKLIAGRHFPKRPGLDFCGIVEAVGEGVSGYHPGDVVFGGAGSMSEGAFAEYVLVKTTSVAQKPASLDDATAAGVPVVAIAALQALRDLAKVRPGNRVLVNGCTGGVGLFALQLAKQFGAIVTGVCGTDGVSLARQFGATEVIDYKKTPVSELPSKFQAILELSGKLAFNDAENLLEEGGLYVDFSPSPAALIGNMIANPFRHHKHVFAMTAAKTPDLNWLSEQIDAGELRPAPTVVYPLERFLEAFTHAESGGAIGKTVVELAKR